MDENIIDEFHVSSKTTDNCVEPTIIQCIVVKKKLSQSEVDRMVQEAEQSRDEDEVNESKHEAESGEIPRYCVKHTKGNPQGRLRAVTGTDEDMDRILITDDSHVKRSSMCVSE